MKCFYSSTKNSSDVFYLSGISVPDQFISIITNKLTIAVVNQLEYSRVYKESNYSEVYEFNSLKTHIIKNLKLDKNKFNYAHVIYYFFKKYKYRKLFIPRDFPSFLLIEIQSLNIPYALLSSPIIESRKEKQEKEIKHIKRANKISALGLSIVQSAIKNSRVKSGYLYLDGHKLTSERLRNMVEYETIKNNAIAEDTIIACGRQASDPHQSGHGPLRANELIIVDIFPRLIQEGYYGDMSRTFLKGVANDSQKKLVYSVQKAQKIAIDQIKADVRGDHIHKSICEFFYKQGYESNYIEEKNQYVGFIHSTGHGVGLDIHEPPSIGFKKETLRLNNVITIEPGLYYPEIGSCRIEDVFLVDLNGSKKLSNFNYQWHIK